MQQILTSPAPYFMTINNNKLAVATTVTAAITATTTPLALFVISVVFSISATATATTTPQQLFLISSSLFSPGRGSELRLFPGLQLWHPSGGTSLCHPGYHHQWDPLSASAIWAQRYAKTSGSSLCQGKLLRWLFFLSVCLFAC